MEKGYCKKLVMGVIMCVMRKGGMESGDVEERCS